MGIKKRKKLILYSLLLIRKSSLLDIIGKLLHVGTKTPVIIMWIFYANSKFLIELVKQKNI